MATAPRSTTAPCVDGELMPQRQVLEDEISAGADRCEECCDKQTEVEHRRASRGSPILCYLSIEPHGSSFALPRPPVMPGAAPLLLGGAHGTRGRPVLEVSTALDHTDSGDTALSMFQRGYVWNRDQVRGLDSLYHRHPVGSLLVWATAAEGASHRGGAPSRSRSRRRWRPWSLRINSRTYSLDEL